MNIPKNLQDRVYWVNPKLDESELIKKIQNLDLFVSDIDGTIAPCQATKIVRDKVLGHPKNTLNPKMWGVMAAYLSNPREKAWEKFKEHFLSEKDLADIREKYSVEYAHSILFKGYSDFLEDIPSEAIKIYLTGNIPEIAQGFVKATRFNDAIHDAKKNDGIELISQKYPARKRIWFSGDHPSDEDALDFLKFKKQKNEMDYFVSLFVSDSPRNINEKYDINIAQDYTGLNELLHSRQL